MTAITVRNISDSYVKQSAPNTNYRAKSWLHIGTGADAYMFWANSIPAGAQVLSATLYFQNTKDWAGATTVWAKLIAAKWSANTITWNNKPALGTDTAQISKTDAVAHTWWAMDITALMQYVAANPSKWYGIRINSSSTRDDSIQGAESWQDRRPYVEIEWSDAPLAPDQLVPRSGLAVATPQPRLDFDFVDVSGDTDMASYQVQVSTDSTFAAVTYDSGVVNDDTPSHDLAGTAFNAAQNTTYYWRVRVTDGAGLTSDWSIDESFTYVPLPAITFTNPTTASPVVEDTTPPISWTFGGVQERYQIRVWDVADMTTVLYNSGKITSTDQTVTLPAKVVSRDDHTYRLELRVWDNVDRIQTQWATATIDFTYNYDATTDPVSSIVVTAVPDSPQFSIDVERSVAPDKFVLKRDGDVVQDDILPQDVRDANTATLYHILDIPSGRASHTYSVVSVINGKSSHGNPQATLKTTRQYSWVMDLDYTNQVALLEPSMKSEDNEVSGVFQPVGAKPVLITQYVGHEMGDFSGQIVDGIGGRASKQQRDSLRTIRRKKNGHCYLFTSDFSGEVYIYNLSFTRISNADGSTDYLASFSYFEV